MPSKKHLPIEVIFYIYYEDLNVLNPYLYAIKMWGERGYDVSVYSLYDEKRNGAIPASFRKDFVHHFVSFPLLVKLLCTFIMALGAIPQIVGLRRRGGKCADFVKMVYFDLYCFFKTDKKKKAVLIAADPPSLWAAALISKRTKNPYIYFVKEIFLSGDITSPVDRLIKYLERKANKNALFTVEFDETRAELLRRDNQLAPESMIVVPNAPPGEACMKREQYFHERFKIEKEKKIVLYTGGIANYNLTYEIIRSTETWPDNIVLVMHCWGSKEEIDRLKDFACRFKREIYFSTEMLLFDEINKIYSSCDIGFALYGDQNLNHKYTGLSSGKLFNFMKACVPTINNDTPSCKKAVEETGCGVCIKDISEISEAIREILKKEMNFKENCQKNFSTFNFDRNYKKLIEAVEHHFNLCS